MIEQLSNEQKSEMLARLCGWFIDEVALQIMDRLYGKYSAHTMSREVWRDNHGALHPNGLPDFYSTENMALAWDVLNWAMINLPKFRNTIEENFLRIGVLPYFELEPKIAQKAWLDRILKLAVEAGLVNLPMGIES